MNDPLSRSMVKHGDQVNSPSAKKLADLQPSVVEKWIPAFPKGIPLE